MTDLTRRVVRRGTRPGPGPRTLIIALEPGDIIAIREAGRRTWFRTTLAAVYCLAVKAEVAAQKAAKRQARRRA